jgi:hypothetical protein
MSERIDQLPYYREYVEQILRPRVTRLIDDVRARLTEQVWAEIVERMAEDQKQGGTDAQSLEKLRALLTDTLGLKVNVQLEAQFGNAQSETPPRQPSRRPRTRRTSPVNNGSDVVDRAFPNNPLARAVGGMRRAGA